MYRAYQRAYNNKGLVYPYQAKEFFRNLEATTQLTASSFPNMVSTNDTCVLKLTTINIDDQVHFGVNTSVELVKLSRLALSAIYNSNSSVAHNSLFAIRIINENFLLETLYHASDGTIINLNDYNTIVDSGASTHVVNSTLHGTNIETAVDRNVALGDNSIRLQITHTCNIGVLLNVVVVPKITLNLISGPCLDLDGYKVVFERGIGTITKGTHAVKCYLYRKLYYCNLKDFIIPSTTDDIGNLVQHRPDRANPVQVSTPIPSVVKQLITPETARVLKPSKALRSAEDLELMHKRFGHANIESIVKGLKDQTIKGYDVLVKRSSDTGRYELPSGNASVV